MEIFSLRCFVTVARLGSFSRAALELYRTQPAVSLQVQKLEGELQQPLLDRSRRAPGLTEAGRVLFAQANDLLERLDGLRNLLTASISELTGTLTIASNASLVDSFLPGTVSLFHEAFPRVVLQLRNLTALGVARAVEEGSADLGVGFLLEKRPELIVSSIARSALVLVCKQKSALAQARRLSLAAVLAGPFVHFEEGVDLRRHLELALAGHGRLVPVLELPTIESILQYVRFGFGCSILPDFAISEHWRKTLAVRGLGRSVAPLEISVCLHRRRAPSRAAAAFLERLRQ
jgi:DNA-binding transcriptional LysR family regulator